MKLLTTELRAQFPRLYQQENIPDPTIYAKFFTPDANWTSYVTEGDADDSDSRFFGFVVGLEKEWGYFHGIAPCWVVDIENRQVEVWTPDALFPMVERERLVWRHPHAKTECVVELAEIFRPI